MTKHTAGKYGRTIGLRERKAGWPAPATAWCYLCNGTHRWEEGCSAVGGHPVFEREKVVSQPGRVTRTVARTAA